MHFPAGGTIPGTGRSPHGERGLKFRLLLCRLDMRGRSPHGERGLKYQLIQGHDLGGGRRSPHGERGLKCLGTAPGLPHPAVAPHTGSVD